MANGKIVKTLTLNAANNWTATVTGLAQKANGQDIKYTWQEANVPAGYQATVDGDLITNTHTPATIAKTVTKQWVDNDNQDGIRPTTITVNLLANGKVVKTLMLSATNNWTATVSGLAQKANGQDIDYTWQEADVPAGYQATVDGDTITNTHTPATISKNVTKQWVDNDNQDGIRPTAITVNLLANSKVVKTLTLSAANSWTATVTGLAQKADGQDINYTWREANVPAGYTGAVDGDTIINTHTSATTGLTVNKVWNDADNKDGLRPTSVTINLLANGRVVQTVDLSAVNNWTASWNNLPVYQAGKQVTYTVEEANIPAGYQSMVSQNGHDFTVTNTHQPTTPNTPNVPNTPSTPTTPNVPGTPATPVQPGTPGVPGQPSVPGQPQTPVQPAQPGMPKQSVGQGQPRLPQTGNHDGLALMALGLAMLSLTLGVVKLYN